MYKIRVTGEEVSIGSANLVGGSTLCRVVNSGATAVLNIGSTGNTTVLGNTSIIVEKNSTDTLTGTGMVAAPIAFR